MGVKYPREEQLYGLVEDGATVSMLAKWYSVDRSVVSDWLIKFDLEILPPAERSQAKIRMESEGRMYPTSIELGQYGKKPSREELLDYVERRVRVEEIAKEKHVKVDTVRIWFQKEQIDRSLIDAKTVRIRKVSTSYMPPKHEIEYLFMERNFTIAFIAGLYKASKNKVGKWTKHYKLRKRKFYDRSVVPPKEKIEDLYINQRLEVEEIIQRLGVSTAKFYRLLDHYKLGRRPVAGVPRPPKATLEHFYLVEGKSGPEIAAYYKTKLNVVRSWLYAYRILRNGKHQKILRPEKSELKRMYIEQNMTAREIGEWFDVPDTRVRKWLQKYELFKKDMLAMPVPDKKVLEDLYIKQNWTQVRLGEKYGVGSDTIVKWLRKRGLRKRPIKEKEYAG